MEYKVDDKELNASTFLSFVNQVWQGDYDIERTKETFSKTLNITAYDDKVLIGCLRILSNGYYFGTITELLVLPEYQKQGVGSRHNRLQKEYARHGRKEYMARHSFIQMSKLPNVKGRISYITSRARQENLYATYRTANNEFWKNLARESQQEFKRSGTEGKCIEARELIIALPEIYTRYEPQAVLEDFTEEFRRQYGMECVSALHHNKRKTNYHIHLIFSERKLLPEPDIKIATRSVFYDETGKRVRTKKEITGEDGQIRKGCTVLKKGEIYESHLFTVKDDKFKSEPFLREVKEIYTDLINRHISDPEQQLKVFDKNSVYLPTKKIGKNNPKAAEIEPDNTARQNPAKL